MSKFRKLMILVAILFAASSVFVACSDDDADVMGPIGINSVQATSNSVTLYWTIVPNSNCDGYNVSIVEGTRANKGSVVVSQDFENRTARGTFTGLKHNTSYVAITKGIPSKGSGFKDAYTYELEFMTTPLVQNITTSAVTYSQITVENEEGEKEVKTVGSVTASWTALAGNAATYTVTLQQKDKDKDSWEVLGNANIPNITTSSTTFTNLITPETDLRVGVRANPGNGEWYAAGELVYYEFSAPAAE